MVHKPKCIFHIHTNIILNLLRCQDACMIHNWCKLFETTVRSVYCYINTPHNTQTTIDVSIHEWFTSDEQCSNPLSQCIFRHTHTTLYTNCYRHQDAFMVHNWCTLFDFRIPGIYSTNTPRTQSTIRNRMHAWFTIDVLFSVSLSQVCIPHRHTTYHILSKLQETSGCIHWLQMMYGVRVHNTNCIRPHASTISKLLQTSGCINAIQVMHTVRVHNCKGMFHIHTYYVLLQISGCSPGLQVIWAVPVHNPRCILSHKHTT